MNRKQEISRYFAAFIATLIISSIFITPSAFGNTSSYYYLQIASFQESQRASNLAKQFHELEENAVVRGEEVGEIGFWYRVYLGPFANKKIAETKDAELKDKGLIDYSLIHKKNALIANMVASLETVPVAETTYTVKTGPVPKGTDQNHQIIAMSESEKPHPEGVDKNAESLNVGNNNRMLKAGQVAASINHTAREIDTELTKQTLTRDTGAAITTTDITITDELKDDFPTFFKSDTLRIRIGLTDQLEIFGDLGAAYDQTKYLEVLYGGGARMGLFKIEDGPYEGIYGALQGEYMNVDLVKQYNVKTGIRWQVDANMDIATARLETGIVRPAYSLYMGGAYLYYHEKAELRQLENLPAGTVSITYQNEAEDQDDIGAFAGVSYKLTPSLHLQVEGQVGHMKSLSAGLEYYF